MKIMVLHDPYKEIALGSLGGEDNLVQLEIDNLRKLGHEVFDERAFDRNLRKKINQLRAQSYGSTPDVIKKIKYFKPDVIHTHNLNQRSGYKWMQFSNVPIISSLHNYRIFCPSSIAWRSGSPCFECRDKSALNAIKHQCDSYVGIINATRFLFFQKSNPQIYYPKKFILASHLMAETMKSILPESKTTILRSPGITKPKNQSINKERNDWLYAGRLTPEKGILNIIHSWPREENLNIAGDGPLLAEIKNIISSKPNIKLIGLYPPGDTSIYSKYEGLIFGSTWYEGSPLVVADCLSTGTPVICTDESGASELIDISKGGFVIKGELNEIKLKNAIIDIRKNFKLYSDNAIKSSFTEFSVENWASKLEKIIYSVLK